MKHFWVISLSVLFIFISITVFALKEDNFDGNAFAIKCHWFIHTNSNIVQGHSDSITETLFKNGLNWTIAGNPSEECIPVQFICAICYDDTKYTLTQALNSVWQSVVINGWQHGVDLDPTSGVLKIYITNTHLVP